MAIHSLRFRELHEYESGPAGIVVDVTLSTGLATEKLAAKVDTGADSCVFNRMHGEALGLEIELGSKKTFSTAAGTFVAYGHNVSVSTLGFQIDDVEVYFAAHADHPRNVLGRRGWIEQFRLAIIHYDRKLYLSKYDDPCDEQ